jgi:hypothetical protein
MYKQWEKALYICLWPSPYFDGFSALYQPVETGHATTHLRGGRPYRNSIALLEIRIHAAGQRTARLLVCLHALEEGRLVIRHPHHSVSFDSLDSQGAQSLLCRAPCVGQLVRVEAC